MCSGRISFSAVHSLQMQNTSWRRTMYLSYWHAFPLGSSMRPNKHFLHRIWSFSAWGHVILLATQLECNRIYIPLIPGFCVTINAMQLYLISNLQVNEINRHRCNEEVKDVGPPIFWEINWRSSANMWPHWPIQCMKQHMNSTSDHIELLQWAPLQHNWNEAN